MQTLCQPNFQAAMNPRYTRDNRRRTRYYSKPYYYRHYLWKHYILYTTNRRIRQLRWALALPSREYAVFYEWKSLEKHGPDRLPF
jgi:hypothetical protein